MFILKVLFQGSINIFDTLMIIDPKKNKSAIIILSSPFLIPFDIN